MTKKRRNLFCARILCASILFSLAAPVSAEETASAVSVEAPEYVLMEPETGTVILEKDKDVPRSPASVTKVMTLLLIFEEIEKGNLKLDDTVTTSAHAKSMGGSQVFLEEGDVVLCESPTYLAAISAFRAYGCRFAEVETDEDGMVISRLEKALEENPEAKLIYIVPDFQNPTGRTWSLARRRQLAELSSKYNVVVIEDNPYGELRYEGDFLPSVKSFDKEGNVLCTGTFSKIFCPGYRIGWIAGEKEVIRKYVLVKQGVDLQCNTVAQMVISSFLEKYNIDDHIDKIREVYHRRRDAAVDSIERFFPDNIKYTKPEGGLFLWVELDGKVNTTKLLEKCLEQDVAFVPGDSFYPNSGKTNTMRINFSNTQEEKIVEGIRRIGNAIRALYGID